jgi:2',3'-cyclic-nucleotide 2'-phosphodiesterase
MGRLFMEALDDPFARLESILAQYPLGRGTTAIVVDFHGEATSEKMAFGHFADGRVSAVLGTHTHVPTADAQILPGGTAYVSDAGMCGDYDSVIGMQKAPSVRRFVTRMPGEKAQPAEGEATLCGVFVAIDDATGLALRIEPVRVGGRLPQHVPLR